MKIYNLNLYMKKLLIEKKTTVGDNQKKSSI